MVVRHKEDEIVGELAGAANEFFELLGGDFIAALLDIELLFQPERPCVWFLIHISARNQVLAHSGLLELGAVERGRRWRRGGKFSDLRFLIISDGV